MAKQKVRIGHLRITDHLVLGVTKFKLQKGTETFQHCDLETIQMDGWDYLGDALQNGEIDGAFILAPYAMELFHSGLKLKMVMVGHKNGSVVISNKRLNVQKVEDFKGKTILIPFHLSIHMMLFDRMLKEKGLETGPGKDVVFDVVAPAQIPEYMAMDDDGDIGGFIVAEPFGSQVVKEGYGLEFALSKDLWPNHPCCVFVVNDDIINKSPEAVQELCDSFVKSGLLIDQKPDVAAKVGSAFLAQDLEVMQRVLTQPKDRLKTSELMPNIADLDIIQKYLTEQKSAMSDKIDLEKFVDFRFAKAAGAK